MHGLTAQIAGDTCVYTYQKTERTGDRGLVEQHDFGPHPRQRVDERHRHLAQQVLARAYVCVSTPSLMRA